MDKTPHIIPRSEHSISRKMLDPNALRVLYRLRDNGFTAYLVGGCVRDLLLGREPKDFDLATDATPGQMKRLFRNCRLVGRRFRLAHLHFADQILEVATFRAAGPEEPDAETIADIPVPGVDEKESRRPAPSHLKSEDGMLLRDNLFGTPQQDALRRDFTVNALFYNIADFSVIDYTAGLADLRNGIIRTIGDPQVRITEDPVRMLRAVRFAATLGFSVDPATWEAMLSQSSSITLASPPRLFEEILKLFLLGEAEQSYQLLRRTGLFSALFPQFSIWLDRETDGFPHTRVGEALEWVDARVQKGIKVPPHLLFALMFGQYVEEKSGLFRQSGANPQQALEGAVAAFLQELSATVQIPGRVAAMARHVLAYQQRFRKMPGRHPASFVRRPGFQDALTFLGATAEITGKDVAVSRWWQAYVQEGVITGTTEPSGEDTSPVPAKSRRRRRRRKKSRTIQPG